MAIDGHGPCRAQGAGEPEADADEPFDLGLALGFESRRTVVEFLTVLALVMVIAAATSVMLLPA